jgi:uncharacterized membrane-anchored protein
MSDFPTRHPYSLGIWQNQIERIMAAWIAELPVRIYYGCTRGDSIHRSRGRRSRWRNLAARRSQSFADRDPEGSPLAIVGRVPVEGGVRYVSPARHHRRSSPRPEGQAESGDGQLPLIGRIFPAPLAAKVPEVILLFWVVKILTTAGGEATSDYLKTYGNIRGGGAEVLVIVVGLVLQFATRRYRAFAYWFLAYAIAITGTGVSDFLHLDVHIPYAGTTLLWAVILAAVFWLWQRSEGTLSIHSITTQRREAFYWAVVFATFALGTALGDFTATSLNLGYLASGILFGFVILIPALARWRLGLGGIAAFWMSYVVTRPLGASFADYISRPHSLSGLNFGDGPTAIVFAVAVFVLVSYLAVTRPDIQKPLGALAAPTHSRTPIPGLHHTGEPELEVDY